jgi:hypothetical protein
MVDHRHLRKDNESEEKALINSESNPAEGAELLEKMKHI